MPSRTSFSWYILSAKYGLVRPDQVLEPYGQALKIMGKNDHKARANRTLQALAPLVHPDDTIVYLAGKANRDFLVDPFTRMGCRIEISMEGLRIGEQMHWLDEQLKGVRVEPVG